MLRKAHARFLGGRTRVTAPGYPTFHKAEKRTCESNTKIVSFYRFRPPPPASEISEKLPRNKAAIHEPGSIDGAFTCEEDYLGMAPE